MRKAMVLRNPASVAAALVLALLTALLAACPQPTDPDPKSSDAALKSLGIATGETQWSLTPVFNADETLYTVNVPTDIESVVVTAEPNHKSATVVSGSGALSAAGSDTVINVVVTAEDGKTEQIYTVTVHRASPDASTNNNLGNLEVSGVDLSPPFSADVTTYTAQVPFETESITITAARADSAATLAGAGEKTLAAGENIFEVTVTAESGAEKVYTIIITREGEPVDAESDATLKTLVLHTGSSVWTLAPPFAPGTTQYTVNVPTEIGNVTIQAEAARSGATATPVGGALNAAGETTPVYVDVTAEDGETKLRYVITIHRAAPDAGTNNNLGNLTVSSGTLTPPFNAAVTEYNLRLPFATDVIVVTAIAADSATATLAGAGTKNLAVGETACEVTVTAQSGEGKTYTITIIREMDARLATLSIAPHTLTPAFDPDTISYTVSQVTYDVTALPLDNNYTTKTVGAAVTVTGNTLGPGTNAVVITVKTTDGTEKTYTLVVSKAANPNGSPDNALKSLSLKPGLGSHESNVPVLSPAFDPDILSYTANGWTNGQYIIIDGEQNHALAALRGTGTRAVNEGDNALSFTVTAENGDVRTYTVNVYRKSSDAGIVYRIFRTGSALYGVVEHEYLEGVIDGASLRIEAWMADEADWTHPSVKAEIIVHPDGSIERPIRIGGGAEWLGIVPVPSPGASITGAWANDVPVTANLSGQYVVDPLVIGDNILRLTITAEDGVTTKDHIFKMTKPEPPKSANARLKSIEVAGAELADPFNPDVLSYRVYAAPGTTSVTITVEKADPTATLEGEDGEGKKTVTVDLPEKGSSKLVEFNLTAEDQNPYSAKTYVLTVIRIDDTGNTTFDSLANLEGALKFMSDNDVDTPYTIRLSSVMTFADLHSGNWHPLGNLMTALKNGGKYVVVDLSALTGTPEGGNRNDTNANDGRAYLVGITLPSSITAIPNDFFAKCVNLKSFDWLGHPNLTSIGQYAFYNTGLTSLVLPANITSLGQYAFEASRLITADLSALPVTSFNNAGAVYCESLETLILPAGATALTGEISNPNLKNLVIPAVMASIYEYAFGYFRPANFTFTVMPGNLKYSTVLDGKALVSEEGLVKTLVAYPSANGEVVIPAGISTINRYAFTGEVGRDAHGQYYSYAAPITGIVLPDSVTSLPDGAFQNCGALQSVTFGSGLTAIPADCFRDCSNLGPVTIPGNITAIGNSAFQGAGTAGGANFSVTFPASQITIGASAFAGSGLTSIAIPASVSSMGGGAFGSSRLISVDMSQSTLTGIPDSTFSTCSSLTTVLLPLNLETIGSSAFSRCTALTQINLPATLTSLGGSVFELSGLSSVTIPALVASIPDRAFIQCTSLVWVRILNNDTLVTIASISADGRYFPFTTQGNQWGPYTYPLIYVPDALYPRYAGYVDGSQTIESEWTNNPAVWGRIMPMSDFAGDFPGQ